MAEWLANKISPYAKGKTHNNEEYAYQTVYNRILHGGGGGRKRRHRRSRRRNNTPLALRHRGGKIRQRHPMHAKKGGILYKIAEQGIKVVQGLNKIISTPSKMRYDPVLRIMVPKT